VTQHEGEEQQVLPAIFEHCRNVYNLMEEEAKLVDNALIWEGHLTKLFARLHLSVPYYTSVTRELKRMDCIRQRRRGGGNAASQWEVVMPPSEELFLEHRTYLTNRKKSRIERVEQQVRELQSIVAKVQMDNQSILDILVEREKDSA